MARAYIARHISPQIEGIHAMITTKNVSTDYDEMEQYDEAGCICDAVTIRREEYYNHDDFSRDMQMPDVTTWYENIIFGWASGTPEKHDVDIYTVDDIPEDMKIWSTEELDDNEREELAERVRACVNNPHNDELTRRAGLRYLGYATGGHDYEKFLANVCAMLESIEYDDVTSF